MPTAHNDNQANRRAPRIVRIIGFVGRNGRVTITDPVWRPTSGRPALRVVGDDRD
jgi:hypothetical protein